MKRFLLAGVLAVAAMTSGCIGGSHGPYAFFRDPGEQLQINRQYDQEVMAKQGTSSSAVGSTSGSGSGTVEYWKY